VFLKDKKFNENKIILKEVKNNVVQEFRYHGITKKSLYSCTAQLFNTNA